MNAGKAASSDKFDDSVGNRGVFIFLGSAFALAAVVFLVALSIPKERRACALMPGFCAPKKEAPKAAGKFEGAAPPVGAAPFGLNQ